MSLDIVSVGSSSSGNSYIIMAGGRTLILDVGLPAKKTLAALAHFGTDPADVDAVLITHEHTDHVKSVRAISRKCCNAVFHASRGTVESTANFCHVPEDRLHIVRAGDSIVLGKGAGTGDALADAAGAEDDGGGITVGTFALSHDAAEPVGFTVTAGGEKLAVVTDTGIVTESIYEAISDADMLVFEANHDVDMLMFGEYPYPVKMRIKGDLGHLSNDYAAGVLVRILEDRRRHSMAQEPLKVQRPLRIMLAHLSFNNNIPLFARQTVEDALAAAGFHKGSDYTLEVAAKEGLTFMLPSHN